MFRNRLLLLLSSLCLPLLVASCNDDLKGDAEDTDTLPLSSDSNQIDDSETGGDGDSDADSASDTGGTAICGNGVIERGEVCDDGNTEDDDGCSADCLTVDLDYDCSVPGEDCVLVVICGNGTIEGAEVCDPGEFEGGCAADCRSVEDGWACSRPGKPCIRIPVCGNGRVEYGEFCDSGAHSDPGCVDCQVVSGYFCAIPGEPCWPEACGNGFLTPNLACDDGNRDDGDGCSANCEIEDGWRCTIDGCRTICGDGRVSGDEECDDGNAISGDGCSAGCRTEPGHDCPDPGEDCVAAECGNGKKESGEGCDDGNAIAGDGCSATCQIEPVVRVGPDPVVEVFCGDGLITGDEECDDGNAANDDGCSSECVVEEGFSCRQVIERPEQVQFKVVYRDFRQRTETGGHPHMKNKDQTPPANGTDRGIAGAVCTTSNSDDCGRLDNDGKPRLYYTEGNLAAENPTISDYPDAFKLWYRSGNPDEIVGANGIIDMRVFDGPEEFVTLTRQGGADSETYVFDSSAGGGFFPLNGRGFGSTPGESRNFHFTTELRYYFQYRGGEELLFRGDDDVFVYVNGRLAVDLGGIHAEQWARVVLGDDGDPASPDDPPTGGDSNCTVATTSDNAPPLCSLTDEEMASSTDNRFGLIKGGVYEIVLFHAERQPVGSNFRLTLSGFLTPRSFCEPICGDGIVVGTEVCDDGEDNADNVYGVCNTNCSNVGFCGDGVTQTPPEACDNGFNITVWSPPGTAGVCAPGCVTPGYCGDGIVHEGFEQCDAGPDNDDADYEGCASDCTWGPFCGDGKVQEEFEACDEGFGPSGNVAWSPVAGACGYDCQPAPYCGDGERNGPEQCDLGTEKNTGAYGECNEDCTLAPHCGDGIVQKKQGETCDDGPQGSITCTPECRLRTWID